MKPYLQGISLVLNVPIRHDMLIDLANRKKNKLLELIADGSVTREDFKFMTPTCNAEIKAAEDWIAALEQIAQESEAFHKRIEKIKRTLANAQRDAGKDAISQEFVEKYIDKIFVTSSGENTLLLQVKLCKGEVPEKYL